MHIPTLSKFIAQCSALLAALIVASCGGGVDSGGTGGSAVVGPIAGLGSIIVNGIRFDESAALVTDEDGQVIGRDRLKLGVFTVVEGSRTTTTASGRQATASRVKISSELVGEIQAIDKGSRTIVVLEQPVKLTAATVFEDGLAQGIDSLAQGMSVEIYARLDASTGSYAATRIEQRSAAAVRQVRGRIDSLDASARTMRIGALVVDISPLSAADASRLSVGSIVRVRLQPGASTGSWKAISASPGPRPLADSDESSIEGRISSLDSLTRFEVDGVAIDASSATFPNGTAGLVLGARVEVEGRARNGFMTATQVRIEGDEDVTNSVYEVHGPIEFVDSVSRLLRVRGITIDYSGPVAINGGSAVDLLVGRQIEVKGTLPSSGVGLLAQEIKFESN